MSKPRPGLHRFFKVFWWALAPVYLVWSVIAPRADVELWSLRGISALSIVALAIGESANEDAAEGRKK